jgi:restriction endonuclease Mrr
MMVMRNPLVRNTTRLINVSSKIASIRFDDLLDTWRNMLDQIDEIPRERINLILKTVFELLWFETEGLYVSDIIRYLRATIPFTEFETGYYSFVPYIPRYEVIMRIGTIPLVRAGWLEKTKNGRWFITSTGRIACNKYKNSEDFFDASIQLFQQWKFRENKRLDLFDSDPFNTAKDFSTSNIRQYLDILDIKDIRLIIASLLKALGCHVLWNVPDKEDNSIVDMICSLDPLGLRPPRLLVHISKCSEITTSNNIDAFSRQIEPNDIGMYFSFGGFSEGAQEHVLKLPQPRIRLFDLDRFINLWIENVGKIDQEGYAKLPLRPVYFLGLPGHLRSLPDNSAMVNIKG